MTPSQIQSPSETWAECRSDSLCSIRFAAIALLFSILLAGCGQRGPLYLPDEPPPASSTGQASGPVDPLEEELEEEDDLEGGNLQDEDMDDF